MTPKFIHVPVDATPLSRFSSLHPVSFLFFVLAGAYFLIALWVIVGEFVDSKFTTIYYMTSPVIILLIIGLFSLLL